MPSFGQCRLCLLHRPLCMSHLAPAGGYKRMRDTGAPNPRPILIHGGIARSTDFKIQDYLLCSECEELFNKNGERWVLNNCYQPDGEFPIRTALLNSPRFGRRPKLLVYAAAQIPTINRE